MHASSITSANDNRLISLLSGYFHVDDFIEVRDCFGDEFLGITQLGHDSLKQRLITGLSECHARAQICGVKVRGDEWRTGTAIYRCLATIGWRFRCGFGH
jgi:hypothetical protein